MMSLALASLSSSVLSGDSFSCAAGMAVVFVLTGGVVGVLDAGVEVGVLCGFVIDQWLFLFGAYFFSDADCVGFVCFGF